MQVTSRKSRRYQLNGQITRGDVSLTILNVNNGDNGAYCCRIEVRGWFNDIKKNMVLQVDIATTTASTTTITTTPHRIITSTTTPLTTMVALPTTSPFLSTIESAFSTVPVVTENTNVATMATSSVLTDTTLITVPPLDNINSLTTSFQDESTDDGSWFFVTEILPSTTGTTTASLATITTTSHRMNTINSNSFLASTVTPPFPPPFVLTTDSVSSIIPIVVPTTTNASAMTTSSVSTPAAVLTMGPSLVNIKPSPTYFQEERTKNDCCLFSEVTSITGSANALEFKDHIFDSNLIIYVTSSSAILLVLLALVIAVKCKQRQKFNLSKRNSLNGQKDPEQMLAGPEGENGLFIL